MNKPIYLHVFDRELRTLIGAQFSDKEVCDIVYTGVLASKFCYIGNSNLAESYSDFAKAVELVYELEKFGCVKVLTTTISKDEFIEGRKRLYFKVQDLYPMYFGKTDVLFPTRPQVLKDSTTTVLQANILLSLDINVPRPLIKKVDDITNAIHNRDGNGITVGILNKMVELDRIEHFHTGLLVSKNYNKRYLDVMGGCLLKGLSWVNIFDDTSDGNYDYLLYYNIMEVAFLKYIKQKPSIKDQALAIFALKGNQYFLLFQSKLYDIITNLIQIKGKDALDEIRWEMMSMLKPRLENLKEMSPEGALECLLMVRHQLENKYNIQIQNNPMKTILYIVATVTEFEKVAEFYKKKGSNLNHFELKENVYYNLGVIRSSQVYLVKSGMGAKKPDASILTIKAAIDELKPDFMIMVGIAFGLKEEQVVDGKKKGSQSIGDVLVSSEIEDYGTIKVLEDGTIERGLKSSADPALLKRFSSANILWNNVKVHTGLVITADVLVNRKNFREDLQKRFPDAIGGEMEGCGFLANSNNNGHWILVKAICDFAYNKGDEFQGDAAMNAIEYVDFVIRNYDL